MFNTPRFPAAIMEFYQPLQHKRARAHAGFDVPVSVPSYIPFVDTSTGFTHPPFVELQAPPERTAASYGYASGVQIYHDIPLEHSQKRRRLENQFSMYDQTLPGSAQEYQEKIPAEEMYTTQQSHDHPLSMSRWVVPATVDGRSLGSPLARVAELLPCCNIGWHHTGGYQPIPETPPVVYDSTKPYSMEAAPSMAIQNMHPLIPASEELPPVSFSPDQPIPDPSPLTSYPLHAHLSLQPPPAPLDGEIYQPNQPASEYYTTKPLVKQGTYVPNPPVFPLAPMVSGNQPLAQYGPQPFPVSTYPPMLNHNVGPPGAFTHYSVMPADVLPHPVSFDCWSHATVHGQISNFDILLPNQRAGKRGPFRDQNLREQTAQTRKMGSCIRCRMQRIRCEHNPTEPGGGCLTCKKAANTKSGRFPCLRYKITDIRLYKPGQVPGYEWTRRWNNNISDPIQRWASSEVKVIRISDGYSQNCIEFQVRRFVPQEGDKLDRTWDYNGTKKSVAIPPYALMDLEDGKMAYKKHIHDSMSDIIRKVLGYSDGILYHTYLQAWHIWKSSSQPSETKDLLEGTLRLWASIRLSTTSGYIVGEETLGMPFDILDQTSPSPGKIPVPPVLGAQMDLILIHHIQTKLRRELLDKLQKIVLRNKPTSWLVTYIVTFILLHNAALITAHDASYARKHGMKRRFAREDKVQEYHLGANILLAHFHYCNKGVHPFSDECRDQDLRTLANLDEGKIQFVRATRTYARRHKQEWEELRARGDCEDDYFFVSQLFEEGWQPRSTVL